LRRLRLAHARVQAHVAAGLARDAPPTEPDAQSDWPTDLQSWMMYLENGD